MRNPFRKKKKTNTTTAKASAKPYKKVKLSNREFKKWLNSKPGRTINLSENFMNDPSTFMKNVFDYVTRYCGAASSAVWIWGNLTSTPASNKYIGGNDTERAIAKKIIESLDERINPFPYVKGGGINFLLDQLFNSIFKYGRFACQVELDRSASKVESVNILDPFEVKFDKKRKPYYPVNKNQSTYKMLNENTFFYYGLDMSWGNPYGTAMLESASGLIEMAQGILSDMKHASSNAGLPRMHIKISQPDMVEGENQEDYISRISSYFDAYVDQFAEIGADDNFYSWDDVEIGVVGGNETGQYVFKTNYNLIDEEIISAFHLYPWTYGKSASTTKNWVRSQFDLLMSQAASIRKVASRLANWIKNTELRLQGINNVNTLHVFSENRDPARKDQAIAERYEIGNVERKVQDGVISPNDGARELGYDIVYNPKLFYENKKSKSEGVNLAQFIESLTEFNENAEKFSYTQQNDNHKKE